MKIGQSVVMNKTVFDGSAAFDFMKVGGRLNLSDSHFTAAKKPTVSFIETTVRSFSAANTDWPIEPGTVSVEGLTYQEPFFSDSEDKKARFITLLEQSNFDRQSYQRLENYYRNKGYLQAADNVHVKSQQRERREGMARGYWRWVWNYFLDVFILYGKDPLRALLWFLGIVVFGFFMFRKREKMRPIIETDRRYRPFLYSLDLFLPLVDLGYAKFWEPNPERKLALIYAKIHQYLAWILIPIALLAVAGVLD
jgi:hypothetical protein